MKTVLYSFELLTFNRARSCKLISNISCRHPALCATVKDNGIDISNNINSRLAVWSIYSSTGVGHALSRPHEDQFRFRE